MLTLDDEQLQVAEHTAGALVVIATAGSGKTTAITERIARIVQSGKKPAQEGLALTFTNKAANELKHRLALRSVTSLTTGTFHAIALRQLSYFWPQVFGGSIWPIGSRSALLATLTSHLSPLQRRFVETEIDWLKSSGLDAATYSKLTRGGEVQEAEIAEIFGRYQDLTHTRRVLDFDDILQLTIGLLSNNPEILKEVRKRYTWFNVDEFQDVTPVQNALLRLWVGERTDICVVGDPAQTIYSFAGARVDFLNDFWIDNATRLELSHTYRCPAAISALASSLMTSTNTPIHMRSESQQSGSVHTVTCENEIEEAEVVATEIKGLLQRGTRPQDIAVLLRLSSMSQAFETTFEKYQIPYSMKGTKPFFDRPEIQEILFTLRKEFEASSIDVSSSIREVATRQGWSPTETAASESGQQIWESITGLLNLAESLGSKATLGEFFHHVAMLSQQNLSPEQSVVTISTLHSAKGLEWSHVFIPGLVEGVLPYSNEHVEEERRLLFVGITRSKDALYLIVPRHRFGKDCIPSRFLGEMKQANFEEPKLKKVREQSKEEQTKTALRCRVCGKGLTSAYENALQRCRLCESDVDQRILDDLLAWRSAFAEQTNQIDWLVVTDATLHALSEIRPQSKDALSHIQGLSEANIAAFGDVILEIILKRE